MPVVQPNPAPSPPPGSGPRIVATPDPGLRAPGVFLQVAGLAANQAGVVITRWDADGFIRQVREAEPLLVDASGYGTAVDHDVPYGTTARYSVSSMGLVSEPVRLDVTSQWLVDVGNPAASVELGWAQLLEVKGRSLEPRARLTEVVGREDPIVSVMGTDVASATSGLVVRTETVAEGVALRELLRSTSVVLLQVPAFAGQRALWEYVHFTSRREEPVARGLKPALRWDLDYRVVARPSGRQRAVRSLDALGEQVATLDDLGLLYESLDDIGTDALVYIAP